MKSIKINLSKSDEDLFGQSKWWGQADMPDDLEYPLIPYDDEYDDDPMTLVCQIRCADLAPFDTENLLPHKGMLYFFAAIDEYVHAIGDYDNEVGYHNGLGEWEPEAYRVLYSPNDEELATHTIQDADGDPYGLPAEKITFETADFNYDSFKLLGVPYYEEIKEQYPDYINLLQIDSNDDWRMPLYDCGMICFLIRPEDLKALRFDRVLLHFFSF